MISKLLAGRIWTAYREIEKSKELLAAIEETIKKRTEPFGNLDDLDRHTKMQFGVPTMAGGHTMYYVDEALSLGVIRAHIANQKARLVSCNEEARLAISSGDEAPARAVEDTEKEGGNSHG